MHCDQPACASACPTTAMFKTDLGPVVFDESRCIGCRACMQACPFIIPKYDYESFAPKIHKCTFCADRLEVGLDPACATVCPTGAISFGDRDDMVVEAKRRIATAPGTYIPEIYGLDEVGGTSVLHLSSVPFEKIGYITGLPKTAMPDLTHRWLRVTAPVFAVCTGCLARSIGSCAGACAAKGTRENTHELAHPAYLVGQTLLAIMAVAAVIAFVRFATGIGTIANINNAYPWGWWVGYGIMTMIAIGGVGFTITALVEILGVHRYHSFRAPGGAHGFSLLRQRDHYAHGGAWPAVDGLDGPRLLGADLRVVRSRLVRVFVSHGARFGIRAGAARGGRLEARISCRQRDLHPDHAPRCYAVASASVIARHADDAHPAQDQRPVVVG